MVTFLKSGIAALIVLLMATISASAQSTYKIQSGDTLQLEVLEDANLNRGMLVLPDGTVSVPLVGSVPAAGRTLAEVRSAVTAGLAPSFASGPTVFLSVGQVSKAPATGGTRTITVYIMGEINQPGKLSVRRGTTLLQALAESGGMTKFASTKRLQLHRTDARGNQASYTFNYNTITSGAQKTAIVLQSGDVITVPPRRLFE